MPKRIFTSWGRIRNLDLPYFAPGGRFDSLPVIADKGANFLPYGNGRSYGDSCLNQDGVMLVSRPLNRFIDFDPATGVLSCEAGVMLSEILSLVVPQGWFLSVTPGTRFVTVGGAIANDVHGKNHHLRGTFGRHLRRFELLRSDGQRLLCSPGSHENMFAATIGGLGLTGFITWAEIQLRRIRNPWINGETIRFETLAEFLALCGESDRDYEYTVAWVDCAGTGKSLGRGLFMRGNHALAMSEAICHASKTWTFPFEPPLSMVNAWTLKAINTVYYHKQFTRPGRYLQHYAPFFYPLDGLLEWNRLYGPRGFYQYQCVIPASQGEEAIVGLLNQIAGSGMGSFLAVLKVCGDIDSPGMLSFPLPGVSLALDFPNRGEKLHRLFRRLDEIVTASGGRLYPAKDGRMPGGLFRGGYPRWQEFSQFIDPHFSSSFWRRVMENT